MLRIENLTVNYGNINALRQITFSVNVGEFISLIGPNGAGKSTLLKSIAGVVKPSKGNIKLLNKKINGNSPEDIVRNGISLVPEGRHIFSTLTVRENLILGATICRDRQRINQDIEEMFEYFPILKNRIDGGAGKLSGGEQQQLAIARALMSKPKVLMLDEPSLGLSPMMANLVFEILSKLHNQGITILLVEQFARRAIKLSDRTLILRKGEIVLENERDDIQNSVDIESKYFGTA